MGFLPNFHSELCRPELLEPLAARITHLAGAAVVSCGSPDSPSNAFFLECIFNNFFLDFVHFLKVVNRVLHFTLFYLFRYQKGFLHCYWCISLLGGFFNAFFMGPSTGRASV